MSSPSHPVGPAIALRHDGDFEGFLTAVFEIFRLRLESAVPVARRLHQPSLLEEARDVDSDPAKAARVRDGILERAGPDLLAMFRAALLSERPGIEACALRALRRLFASGPGARGRDVLDPDTMDLLDAAEAVRREAHRFQGFVRFSRAPDGSLFAVVAPDHDILGILVPHFQARFPNESWSLFDFRRGRCVRGGADGLESFFLDPAALPRDVRGVSRAADPREAACNDLWLAYYRATNIAERANPKLLARNLPRKYWRYLPERQVAGIPPAAPGRRSLPDRTSENAPPPATM